MRRMIPDNEWKKQIEDLQALYNGYTSDDASTKKIYCHPISVKVTRTDNSTLYFSLLIINNQATAFADYTAFINELQRIFNIDNNAVFPCSGGAWYSVNESWYPSQEIFKDEGNIRLRTIRTNDGTSGDFIIDQIVLFSTIEFKDGVNAIN